MKLSFITDEVTQDFQTVLAFAERYGFDGVELRSVEDVAIDRIPPETAKAYQKAFAERGLTVSNLASSFYKCNLGDDEAVRENLDKLWRLCDLADIFGCSTIRGFTFFKGPGCTLKDRMEEILSKFEEPVRILKERGKTLLLESDPSVYTTNHRLLTEFLDALHSPQVGAIFDPGNDVYDELGEVPYPDGYNFVKGYIRHVHIKDAVKNAAGEPECVKIGTGLVRYPELLAALKADGYGGFCSLIALVPEHTQRFVGQRRADLPAADIIIGDGDDGTILPGQIVKGHFIVGTQRFSQKFGQLDVMLKDQVGRGRHKIPSFHFAYFQAMKILYMRKSYCQSKK